MAAMTGLGHCSIDGSMPPVCSRLPLAGGDLAELLDIRTSTKVRPPPMRTIALIAGSWQHLSMAASMPSGTPGLERVTGGLLTVITPTSSRMVSSTSWLNDNLEMVKLGPVSFTEGIGALAPGRGREPHPGFRRDV